MQEISETCRGKHVNINWTRKFFRPNWVLTKSETLSFLSMDNTVTSFENNSTTSPQNSRWRSELEHLQEDGNMQLIVGASLCVGIILIIGKKIASYLEIWKLRKVVTLCCFRMYIFHVFTFQCSFRLWLSLVFDGAKLWTHNSRATTTTPATEVASIGCSLPVTLTTTSKWDVTVMT